MCTTEIAVVVGRVRVFHGVTEWNGFEKNFRPKHLSQQGTCVFMASTKQRLGTRKPYLFFGNTRVYVRRRTEIGVQCRTATTTAHSLLDLVNTKPFRAMNVSGRNLGVTFFLHLSAASLGFF